MRRTEILNLEDEIATLEISVPLLTIVKDGTRGYLYSNEEIIDDAICSASNIQQGALNRLRNKYQELTMEVYNAKY